MMLRIASRLKYVLDELIENGSRMPPLAPAFATAPSSMISASTSQSYNLEQMVEDMRILLGVPKYRTSKPKKTTRKFSYTRVFSPVDNLITCQTCGTQHQVDTICGTCYSKVRELTNAIKEQMMKYNPYKGDKNDKEVFVKFNDDKDKLEDGVLNGKRIVELDRPRPTWFKKVFRQ